jgi:hypothetical protein
MRRFNLPYRMKRDERESHHADTMARMEMKAHDAVAPVCGFFL